MDTNSVHDDHKGSISLRAQETGSGRFRFFFDDDDESFFDLNLEKIGDSEEFEFQISFSPLPVAGFSAHNPADELFRDGRILPLQGVQVVPNHGEQQVFVAEKPLQESSIPVNQSDGGVSLKVQVDPSSENIQRSGSVRQCTEEKTQQGPTGTRKASKASAAKKINSGVMKFLVKFPSDKIRSTFMSIVRSYHSLSLQNKRGQNEAGMEERGGMYKRLVMQFSRWLAIRKRSRRSKSGGNAGTSSRRPSDVDLDEDVVRSILAAVDFAVGSRSREATTSSHVSPRHSSSPPRLNVREEQGVEGAVMERNSSITSAIAHCKMSYNSNTALSP